MHLFYTISMLSANGKEVQERARAQKTVAADAIPCPTLSHMKELWAIRNQLFEFMWGHQFLRPITLRQLKDVEIIETGRPDTRSISSMNRRVSSVSCSTRYAFLLSTEK